MGRIIYFTGGARSGKSAQAEQYIFDREYTKRIYIATSIPKNFYYSDYNINIALR